MITQKDIREIEKIAQTYFEGASGCHDWTHIERVYSLAVKIAKMEKADIEIIKVAALLHDIGRKNEMENKGRAKNGKKICHAKEGKREAKKIFENFNFSEEEEKKYITLY